MKRSLLCSPVVFGALLFLAACGNSAEPEPTATATPKAASFVTVGVTTLEPTEHLAGIIAPFQSVAISSTLTEAADAVYVQEGDAVHKGQTLALLDTADLRANLAADLASAQSATANTNHTIYQGKLTIAQGRDSLTSARASVSQAQATLDKDRQDLARYQGLFGNGYISQQQVQQQQTTVNNDEKALESVQASARSAGSNVAANGTLSSSGLQQSSVEQSRAQESAARAQADQLRVQIDKATIVSPINGVVVNRNINPGEYPGSRQIFTLQEVDQVYAVLRGSGAQVANVANDSPASIHATDVSMQPLSGRVVGVLNQINPGSTDFQVKIAVDNAMHRLRPGMAVEGDVHLHALRGVTVPTTAFTDDSRSTVLTLGSDHTLKAVRVVARGSAGKQTLVSGIASGTRVLANGQAGLEPGQKVAAR